MPLTARESIGLDARALGEVLEGEGHRIAKIGPLSWRGRFRSRNNVFPFMVHVSEAQELLTMAVVPFMKSPDDDELAKALYDRLLQLNQVLLLAKFSIDDDLDVVLSVAHPTTSLQASEVRDGLSALFYYAENHYEELQSVISPDPA